MRRFLMLLLVVAACGGSPKASSTEPKPDEQVQGELPPSPPRPDGLACRALGVHIAELMTQPDDDDAARQQLRADWTSDDFIDACTQKYTVAEVECAMAETEVYAAMRCLPHF